MGALYHLAYISRNKIMAAGDEMARQIGDILSVAQANNRRIGVTGALLFSGGYFCQVIEGEQDTLEELFETIQMDPRHGEVTVLQFAPIAQRGFADWAMAFAGMEDKMRFDVEGIRQSKDDLAMQEAGRNLVHLLEELVVARQAAMNGRSSQTG